MDDAAYSNRELDVKFENLFDQMKNFETTATDSLARIEVQTIKTNGRVNKLEDGEIANRVFRARITTAIYLLSFIIGSILIPLVGSFIVAGHF